MDVSQAGIALIRRFEGCKLQAYQDPVGIWTIGYGHTGPEVDGDLEWTQDQAEQALAADAGRAAEAVLGLVQVAVKQGQLDALTSFTYNLGEGQLASSTLLRLLNSGDAQGAAAQFGRWVYAGKNVLPGLVKRRAAERDLFVSGA